jgi:hypothetical protein
VKELLPTFRPQQDSNQERAARLTSTRQVNSDRIDAQLPSPICDPTIAKPHGDPCIESDLSHGNCTCCTVDEDIAASQKDWQLLSLSILALQEHHM